MSDASAQGAQPAPAELPPFSAPLLTPLPYFPADGPSPAAAGQVLAAMQDQQSMLLSQQLQNAADFNAAQQQLRTGALDFSTTGAYPIHAAPGYQAMPSYEPVGVLTAALSPDNGALDASQGVLPVSQGVIAPPLAGQWTAEMLAAHALEQQSAVALHTFALGQAALRQHTSPAAPLDGPAVHLPGNPVPGVPYGGGAKAAEALDSQSGPLADKLRREVARLMGEVERLEKEVARQKSLREGERLEFADAKDRLKSSWAVDREDFARVKEALKKKNAEHHIQNGRLSQALKESEAACRGLREACARAGILLPPELEGNGSASRQGSMLSNSLANHMARTGTASTMEDGPGVLVPTAARDTPRLPASEQDESGPPTATVSSPNLSEKVRPPLQPALPGAPPLQTAPSPAQGLDDKALQDAHAIQSPRAEALASKASTGPGASNAAAASAAASAAAALGQLAAALAGQASPALAEGQEGASSDSGAQSQTAVAASLAALQMLSETTGGGAAPAPPPSSLQPPPRGGQPPQGSQELPQEAGDASTAGQEAGLGAAPGAEGPTLPESLDPAPAAPSLDGPPPQPAPGPQEGGGAGAAGADGSPAEQTPQVWETLLERRRGATGGDEEEVIVWEASH